MASLGIYLPYEASPQVFAPVAERAGFDRLAYGEHVLFRQPLLNGFVALSAAAAVTSTVRLLSAITLLPLYPAALAAKLVASLDHLSGGRFEFGVGVGGEVPEEFEACGVDIRRRGRLTDAALETMRALFADEPLLRPKPVQQPWPPVWVGGRSEAALQRTVRWGEYWLPYLVTPEQVEAGAARLRELSAEAGRAKVPGTAVSCFVNVARDGRAAERDVRRFVTELYDIEERRISRYVIGGTPASVTARLGEVIQAGASTVLLTLATDPDNAFQMAELVGAEVRPGL
jgi:alkanesulfonate monooxygenase SsuD/methylene tetrahydromethanopterin reductase-like flavin-dependent oxidoreductase (luciferase family)